MKKWVFWAVLLLLLGCEAVWQRPDAVRDAAKLQDGPTVAIKVSKNQIYEGTLVLVNKDLPVRKEGIPSDVIRLSQRKELVNGYRLLDDAIRLSRDVAEWFSVMMDAAKKDGVRHFVINSGYRTDKEQSQLYREMGADFALPAGYSEHNLGLSLDIGSTQTEMDKAEEGKWLRGNAWKYGFVLRYPKGKTAITGIQYEPWHFRYVGMPHSAIMEEKDFTLEEYLAYLKEHQVITATVEGMSYEVAYYPVTEQATLQVPADRPYELSGNNMDGVIVTAPLLDAAKGGKTS